MISSTTIRRVLALALIAVAIVAVAHAFDVGTLGVALVAPLPLVLPGEMKKKADDLAKLLTELDAGQKEMAAGPLTQARGEELEAKAKEAESLQAALDQFQRISGLTARGREVVDPILPSAGESKGKDEVVGYLSLGEAVTSSPEFKAALERGFPATQSVLVSLDGANLHRKGGAGLIPVTRGQIESKAVTVGAGTLRPTRDPENVRLNQEQDRLLIRDLLNVSRTDGSSVEYITWTLTRAAAPVAEGGAKPEAGLTSALATSPVRTIAVHTPISEQGLQDIPDVQNTIDNELTWDLKKTEEQQLLWGAGTGANILGLFNAPGVAAGRTVGGDTLIDMARRSMTDVVMAGGDPNGIVVHPLDWESMVLAKATTNEYVWVVVTDATGPRLWGARVVETVAAAEPGTFTANERRMLVGDFRRGGTIWDRQGVTTEIGYVNAQFTQNMRTIRVEERLAFGVKRPHFFKYRITVAHAA